MFVWRKVATSATVNWCVNVVWAVLRVWSDRVLLFLSSSAVSHGRCRIRVCSVRMQVWQQQYVRCRPTSSALNFICNDLLTVIFDFFQKSISCRHSADNTVEENPLQRKTVGSFLKVQMCILAERKRCRLWVWLINASAYRPIGRYRRSDHRKSMPSLKQEVQLSPRVRAMRRVSWNLANCHATVQKLLVQQALNQVSAVANWPVRHNRAVDNAWRSVW